jgi:hypothetical protein
VVSEQERQAIVDQEDLDLLPIGYWVSGGYWAVYGLFMIVYFAFMGSLFTSFPANSPNPPPRALGWLFLGFGIFGFFVLAALVALKILVGFWIRKRQHLVATMVVAGITSLEVPYGTLLGVLTFITLARPSVRALYVPAHQKLPETAPPAPPADGDRDHLTGGASVT